MSYKALQNYIKNSELRIVDENLHIRMSPELAQKYDAGVYDFVVAEHADSIREIMALKLLPDNSKKIYIYLIPDDRFVRLLHYPRSDRDGGGRPVPCFDDDGLNYAYGSSQNLFLRHEKRKMSGHVNDLHEYCHLIQGEFATKALLFNEGVAELMPWYLLDYDTKFMSHTREVSSTDVYAASRILDDANIWQDIVEHGTISFQKSYMSAYVFIRTIVEKIEEKYKLDKFGAVKCLLHWLQEIGLDRGLLVRKFAENLGLDSEKLLYTTEYQKEVLQKMSNIVKMKQTFVKPMDGIKR